MVLQHLASLFVKLLESLKGEQTFLLSQSDPRAVSHLVGHSVADYQIHIYCQRKQYCRVYRRWFIPNQYYVLYRVYSVVSAAAPNNVLEACQLDVDIPAQHVRYVSDSYQRERAVEAYLDLVLAKMRAPSLQ